MNSSANSGENSPPPVENIGNSDSINAPTNQKPKKSKNKKKRNLSSSPSNDENKRPNLNESLSLVEELGINLYEADTPHWVPLLLKVCDVMSKDIKGICKQMNSFELFQSQISKRVDSLEQQATINVQKTLDIEKNVSFVSSTFDEMKAQLSSLKQQNDELKKTVNSLVQQVDTNEQHSRSECLLIHGIDENNKETPTQSKEIFAKKVSQYLGVNMDVNCIKRAHRLGMKRTNGKPRPIIVRLYDPELRNIIFAKKKLCKGQNFSITENLTKRRMLIKKEAESKYGANNVWTREGRIYAKNQSDDSIVTVLS